MMIELDPRSTEPPYEQLRTQITGMVLNGELAPGDRLPSIRQLAGDLGLASGTVARAYRELEADGVVVGRGARGTTVLGPPSSAVDRTELHDAAGALARVAARTEASLDEAIGALRIAFAARRSP